jgi:hypothetical protein
LDLGRTAEDRRIARIEELSLYDIDDVADVRLLVGRRGAQTGGGDVTRL